MKKTASPARAKLERGIELLEKVAELVKQNKEPEPIKKNGSLLIAWSFTKKYANGLHYDACVSMYKLLGLNIKRYPENNVAEKLKDKLREVSLLFKRPQSQPENYDYQLRFNL